MTTSTSIHELPRATPGHSHGWATESRHTTSLGVVVYLLCSGCRTRRIEVRRHVDAWPGIDIQGRTPSDSTCSRRMSA